MSSALTKAGATNQFAVILVDEIHRRAHRAVGSRRAAGAAAARDSRGRHRRRPAAARRRRRSGGGHRRGRGAAAPTAFPVTSDIDRLTDRTPELVAAVTIPIFAEHVPPALTGRADPEAALRALRREHDGLLVVTLGTHGALALDGDRAITLAGVPRRRHRHDRRRRRLPRRLHPRPALRLAARADAALRQRRRGGQLHAARRAGRRPQPGRRRGDARPRLSAAAGPVGR